MPLAPPWARSSAGVGDHFAGAKGGRFTSPAVAAVLDWLRAQGVTGVGQSSWGPTGFALLGDAAQADRLRAEASQRFGNASLELRVLCGRNRGAETTQSSLATLGSDAG